jgi:hypothetical protein
MVKNNRMKLTLEKPNDAGYYICRPIFSNVGRSGYRFDDLTVAKVFFEKGYTKVKFGGNDFIYDMYNPVLKKIEWGDKIIIDAD